MVSFISFELTTQTAVSFLFFIHFYLVVRYCVGSIIVRDDTTNWERYKRFLLVVILPFVGYYYVMNKQE